MKTRRAIIAVALLIVASGTARAEESWETLMSAGGSAAGQGNLKGAEKLFEQARAKAESFDSKDPRLAQSLAGLASVYSEQGEFERALPLFEEALARSRKARGLDDLIVQTIRSDMATMYARQGRFDLAEPLLKQALVIFNRVLDESDPRVMTCTINLGSYYLESGEYEKARPLLEKGIDIFEKNYGRAEPMLALYLSRLAELDMKTSRFEESEKLLGRALIIAENAYGPDHAEVARCLDSLGNAYMLQAIAEKRLRKQELIKMRRGRPTQVELINTRNLLTEKAEPLFLKALTIREKTLGID
ncbi:MAG: tetratricopeptide repeat protein, partial [Cyanobacteria bacterium HKST-UBA02]|nr:tetratricopeptide repeat protein [Cyanobacteria bacterium HKST-UBA02]